jgi:hypothetical protein
MPFRHIVNILLRITIVSSGALRRGIKAMALLKMAVDIKGVDLSKLSVGLRVIHDDAGGEKSAKTSFLNMTLDELKVFLKALTVSGDIEITSSLLSDSQKAKPAKSVNSILELKKKYEQVVAHHP